MLDYNLGVLNDKEFENLSKDLLENEWNLKLQSFSRGRDKGIDLRFSQNVENKIIVQCKHYWNSEFSDLRNSMKLERVKLSKLAVKPKRYILITSMRLSVGQVDELTELLKPFISSSNDVYSFDRVNSLIQKFHAIETKYYKLWLSSTTILKRILNNAIEGRSEFYEKKILRRVSLYVPTMDYEKAVKKLKKERFIIITGDPGIGKTTISYLLICELLAKRYQLIYVSDKINEAEQLFSIDPKKKQVFFFDDFLGANLHAITNPKNTESSILNLIERIKTEKNKLLIFTTRTTILRQAEFAYEKLNRSKVSEIAKYEIQLSSYSRLDKAKILYNHLYHSDIHISKKRSISRNENYLKIIDHKNYSPRLIEFITDQKNYRPEDNKNYVKFILSALNNPQEIWRGAYESQLSDNERFLLTTLFSLGGYKINSNILEEAFNERINYEIKFSGHIRVNNSFNNALKKLLDGMIISQRNGDDHVNEYSFINPSVGDFLLHYLAENRNEILRIILSVVYVEQFTKFFHPSKQIYLSFTNNEISIIYHDFVNKSDSLQSLNQNESVYIEILNIYLLFFKNRVDESKLLRCLESILFKEIRTIQLNLWIIILQELYIYDNCTTYIKKNWTEIVTNLYKIAQFTDEYSSIKDLFVLYNKDFLSFHSDEENGQIVTECISSLFSEYFNDDFDLSSSDTKLLVTHIDSDQRQQAEDIISQALESEFTNFLSGFDLENSYSSFSFDIKVDVSDMVDRIYERYLSVDDDFDSDIRGESILEYNESKEIGRLFE